MRLYSDDPSRRRGQQVRDALVALWVVFWCWQGWAIGSAVHDGAEPARRAERLTADIALDLGRIADAISAVPLMGSSLADLVVSSQVKVQELSVLAADATATVEGIGWKAGLGVALTPSILLLAAYLPHRVRFVRRANQPGPVDLELAALRALLTQPAEVLHRLTPDPVGGWQRRDPQAVTALAAHQLRWDGVRPPQAQGTPAGPAA